MRSALANFIAGTMALLFAVAFIFCARGMVSAEMVRLEKRPLSYSLYSQEGTLLLVRGETRFRTTEAEEAYRQFFAIGQLPEDEWRWRFQSDMSAYRGPVNSILGFGFEHSESEVTRRIIRSGMLRNLVMIRVPMWFLLGILGIWPAIRFWRKSKLRTTRLEKGHCLKCGFDLQGIYHHCPRCRTRAPIPTGFPVHSWSG
jgi:hypothetical protein